ncbi:GNAT family N-acetyltransferase [Allochromatium palmeri]|nr:GNAT family N-acetyltransferase [Allochromatium palmeri]
MDRYRLRAAEPNDEHRLRELFATVFGESRTAEEWRWKYGASCALATGAGYHCAESVVALDDSEQLVAHAGVLPLPGWREGAPIPIVQVCDVMVHPEHRGGLGRHNLFTLMLRDLLARIAERLPTAFRYGFPGQRPYLIGERSGVYECLEIALESRLSGPRRWNNLWRAAPLDWNDARIDALWERLNAQCRLGLIRDRAYLHWRYADNPSHRYRLYGLSRLGRLAGWGVCAETGSEPSLVDLWLPLESARHALAALAVRLESDLSRTTGIRVWLPTAYRAALGVPGTETPVVVANMRWETAISAEIARNLLYYTMGDVDIF